MEIINEKNRNEKSIATNLLLELPLDYRTLTLEILKQLRGEMTQRQLSQKLGFSFNQVGKWESGATHIRWDEFFRLCEAVNIPKTAAMHNNLWNDDEQDFSPPTYLKALTKKITANDQKISKILSLANPTLTEVLQLLGSNSPFLLSWLSQFVECKEISSLKVHYEQFQQNIDAVLSDPVVVYVNAALQVDEYKNLTVHDESILAEHATCTVERLRSVLKLLMNHHLISFDGKKYLPNPFDFSFSGLAHPKLRGLTKYTTVLAAERYPSTPLVIDPMKVLNPGRGSVRIKAFSKEAAQKVSDLISKFHNDVDEIVRQDTQPKGNVQVVLIHSFPSTINSPFRQNV